MEPILSIKNIETYYDRILALKGVSMDIYPNTITAVLGNNGAGKTTILNTVMGLLDDQPDKGDIYFQGKRISRKHTVNIVKAGIGYVPEGREIFQELTVKENLQVGGHQRTGKEIKEGIDQAYQYFPKLQERERQLAGTLSGGEQQMLAIGRALMNKPTLLFLDEPSLGLSPILVDELFVIIQEIAKTVTVLLVEQNAKKALDIASYGYILESGRFVASGPVDELKSNEDVKEFYLGVKSETSLKGTQRYKRKRRWN